MGDKHIDCDKYMRAFIPFFELTGRELRELFYDPADTCILM